VVWGAEKTPPRARNLPSNAAAGIIAAVIRPAALLICLLAVACERAPRTPVELAPPEVQLPANVLTTTPAQAEALIANPAVLVIDARTHAEWQERGHLPRAVQHDWFHGEAMLAEIAKLDRTQPCLVYCAIGARSKLLAVKMNELGFQRLHWLQGGMNAWVAEGRAVEK
jgi:rhodanese-related sulfurtransferase